MSDYLSHEYMMSIPAREISDSSQLAANPVVSVVMITYNHEKYVAEAIEGVIMQRCDFPIELLIGEDCSTDRTRAICEEYQTRYPQIIRVITADHNVGGHKNFFRLIGRARGRYLALCEGDDYWTHPRKLQMQVAFLEANPGHTLCYHNAQVIYQDTGTQPHLFNRKLPLTLSAAEIIESDWLIPTASMVFRRSLIARFPKDFCSFPSGDLALSILAAAAGKVHGSAECMAVYRKHRGGIHYPLGVDAERRIKFVERVNSMLESLDRTLEGRHRQSFQKRIQQNCRAIDFTRLTRKGQFSPRLLWNSLRHVTTRIGYRWRAGLSGVR